MATKDTWDGTQYPPEVVGDQQQVILPPDYIPPTEVVDPWGDKPLPPVGPIGPPYDYPIEIPEGGTYTPWYQESDFRWRIANLYDNDIRAWWRDEGRYSVNNGTTGWTAVDNLYAALPDKSRRSFLHDLAMLLDGDSLDKTKFMRILKMSRQDVPINELRQLYYSFQDLANEGHNIDWSGFQDSEWYNEQWELRDLPPAEDNPYADAPPTTDPGWGEDVPYYPEGGQPEGEVDIGYTPDQPFAAPPATWIPYGSELVNFDRDNAPQWWHKGPNNFSQDISPSDWMLQRTINEALPYMDTWTQRSAMQWLYRDNPRLYKPYKDVTHVGGTTPWAGNQWGGQDFPEDYTPPGRPGMDEDIIGGITAQADIGFGAPGDPNTDYFVAPNVGGPVAPHPGEPGWDPNRPPRVAQEPPDWNADSQLIIKPPSEDDLLWWTDPHGRDNLPGNDFWAGVDADKKVGDPFKLPPAMPLGEFQKDRYLDRNRIRNISDALKWDTYYSNLDEDMQKWLSGEEDYKVPKIGEKDEQTLKKSEGIQASNRQKASLRWLREALDTAAMAGTGSTRAQQKLGMGHLDTLMKEASSAPEGAGQYQTLFENLVNPVVWEQPLTGVLGQSRAVKSRADDYKRGGLAWRNPTAL